MILKRQFPYLPGIARRLLAREQDPLGIEGHIGVRASRKAGDQRLRVALTNEQQLRALGKPLLAAQCRQWLVNGR